MSQAPAMTLTSFPGPDPVFACAFNLPDDWAVIPPPTTSANFDEPFRFLPVAMAMAKYGTVLLLVAVRPRYPDGAVADWLAAMAASENMQLQDISHDAVGPYPAVAAIASQQTDAGVMVFRVHCFTSGPFLFNVSVMAPAALFDNLVPTFKTMLASFRLMHPQPPSAPLFANEPTPAINSPTPSVEPEPSAPPSPTAPAADNPYAPVAIAHDAASLAEEDPINLHFRNSGAGLVPRIVSIDLAARRATVAAGAILATFGVPLGWHVVDDGQRTLVFDPANDIQASFALINPQGQDPDQILNQIYHETAPHQQGLQHVKFEAAGMHCMALRGLVIDGQPLEQAFFLRPGAPHNLTLKIRLTATAGQMDRAMSLIDALLSEFHFLN